MSRGKRKREICYKVYNFITTFYIKLVIESGLYTLEYTQMMTCSCFDCKLHISVNSYVNLLVTPFSSILARRCNNTKNRKTIHKKYKHFPSSVF